MSYAKAKRRNANALPVIFRAVRYGEHAGVVDAVFPTLPASPGNMVCYTHIGQHSEGSNAWYVNGTRPAHPAEYASLLAELLCIYGADPDPFELVVCKVITSDMRAERIENEKE